MEFNLQLKTCKAINMSGYKAKVESLNINYYKLLFHKQLSWVFVACKEYITFIKCVLSYLSRQQNLSHQLSSKDLPKKSATPCPAKSPSACVQSPWQPGVVQAGGSLYF